jgi:hypothetical protein
MTRGTTTETRSSVYDPGTQRLTRPTHPQSGAATYTDNRTVGTKIDAKNQKIAYAYDSDPFDPTNVYQFLQNGWGRLTAMER